jgi:peptide chain release factor subunit 1
LSRVRARPRKSEDPLRSAITRLSRVKPGSALVVSCYLKLEPRDKTRGKYIIKMKNRVRQVAGELERQSLDRKVREQATADLERIRDYFEHATILPEARGVALFACAPIDLFEVLPLPHVYRSRLAVTASPLIRELVALEEEFGTILAVVCDRTSARFFTVTAYDAAELPGLAVPESGRAGKFHGKRRSVRGILLTGAAGEHNYHMRIREEKQRHYARVADEIFRLNREQPLSVAQVREAALTLREQRERAWERAHAEAARDGVDTGWAVNGVDATLKALGRGQVRTLLADGLDDDRRIDEAIEEALAQRAQVDVLYDERARRAVHGLAALLRFRR